MWYCKFSKGTNYKYLFAISNFEIGVNTRNLIASAQDRYYWKTLVNVALYVEISKAMELVKYYGYY